MGITQSNSGSEAVGIINQALGDAGSSVTVGNESGSSVAGKLNEVFDDDIITSSQSGSQFAQAVDDGFENLEPSELDNIVKFLHVSDPHGYADALEECQDMIEGSEDYQFLFVTGDSSSYNSASIANDIKAVFDSMDEGKLLMLAGNHDTYDFKGRSQSAMTAWLKGYVKGVEWGDTSNVASYWHKDIQLSSRAKLRIISLDQYELNAVRKLGQYAYNTLYSQKQVNWFIGLLKGLTANDYLIVATHEPPVQNQSKPDAYAQAMSVINGDPQKLFMTSGLYSFGSRGDEPNINLFPRIMRAYMHNETLNIAYNNKGGSSSNPDITINETFSGQPATFLFWIGGHQHADICYYLPDESNAALDGGNWSDQLMLYVTAADRSVIYSNYDDLGGAQSELPTPSSPSQETYRINEYEIDFGAKTIKVTRHGDKNTSDGRIRTTITFPFKKS